ncbi:unnamed protein product [Sphagnum troendelagicum]|uniref:Calmodulin-lysine N-methyltransferase n=1 Tax=Sphagnum troendelagicum TaxID=128251 RepID=A0ABP0U3B5_9BRYO
MEGVDATSVDGTCSSSSSTPSSPSPSSLRWSMLGRFISSRKPGFKAKVELQNISRRPAGRFNVIPCCPVSMMTLATSSSEVDPKSREVVIQYAMPSTPQVKICLRQRNNADVELNDFTVSQQHNVDSTGLVCMWPAEEILTYFCVLHLDLFQKKRVIELGAGYGLAGLAIAACTEASEVLITDGNPQVVDYIQTNIEANRGVVGDTKVSACMLHWSRHQVAMPQLNYDVIVAADCTFFKDFHLDLAHTIKGLLGVSDGCQAILFSPRRGNTLDQFVKACQSAKLNVGITEQYDAHIWSIHKGFLTNDGNSAWPNYDEEHSYPLLLSITHTDS